MNIPTAGVDSLKQICECLECLFQNAPFRVYAKNLFSQIVYGNQAMLRAHFPNGGHFEYQTDRDFFELEYAMSASNDEAALFDGKCDQNQISHKLCFEQWKHTRNLTVVEVNKWPILDKSHKVIGLWGMTRELEELTTQLPTPEFENLKPVADGYFYRVAYKDPKIERKSWFSKGFRKLYGWGETIPHAIERKNAIHKDDRERVLDSLRKVYSGLRSEHREDFRMATSQGKELYIRSIGKLVKITPDGEAHFVGYHQDMTYKKANELVSHEVFQRFPGFIFVKDSHRRFRFANGALLTALGLSSESEIIGKKDEDFFPDRYKEHFKSADLRIIEGGEKEVICKEQVPTSREGRLTTEEFWTFKFPLASGLFSADGKPGLLGLATRTSLFLDDVEHHHLLWRCLMDDSEDVVYVKDTDGRYLEVNKGFEELTGISKDQIRSETITTREVINRLAPRFVEDVLREDQLLIQNARIEMSPVTREVNRVTDGTTRVGLTRKWAILDANGKVKGILGISRDVTKFHEMRKAAEDLEVIRSEAKQVEKHVDSRLIQHLKVNKAETMSFKSLVIVFADIRGFTHFSNRLRHNPQLLHSFLNGYYDLVVEIAHKHDGVVDKFIGDGAMMSFGLEAESGAPQLQLEATRAISASIELSSEFGQYLNNFNNRHMVTETEEFLLQLGIGINCGEVLVGNIKGKERDQYTAIGHAVNMTQKIESKAGKEIGIREREEIAKLYQTARDSFELASFHQRDPILVSNPVNALFRSLQNPLFHFRENPFLVNVAGEKSISRVFGVIPR